MPDQTAQSPPKSGDHSPNHGRRAGRRHGHNDVHTHGDRGHTDVNAHGGRGPTHTDGPNDGAVYSHTDSPRGHTDGPHGHADGPGHTDGPDGHGHTDGPDGHRDGDGQGDGPGHSLVGPSAGHGSHAGHGGHGHSHGLVDRSITRSRDGIRTVAISLAVLLATSLVQAGIFLATHSVALLADLIHNFGDALTAIPLGIAFLIRSFVAERRAGYFVVATIFVSACVAGVTAVDRLIHPHPLHHLWILAAAGLVGFAGNEIAARIRLRAGARLESPALIADGNHARTDGFVSLSVLASSILVGLGLKLGDPIIGLTITLVILRITWQSLQTIRADPGPGDPVHRHAGHPHDPSGPHAA